MLTKITFKPTIIKDETALSAEDAWIDANKVRFWLAKPQVIGGWQSALSQRFLGIARGAWSWASLAGVAEVEFGTSQKLYAYTGGGLYDITPITSTVVTSGQIGTTSGSQVVDIRVSNTSVAADWVRVTNAAFVNGITLGGQYAIVSVPDANNITVSSGVTASGTGSGGGNAIIDFYLANGNADGLGGQGYGTGGYGVGGYGSPSTVTYYPRTWSIDNFGQNGLANPRNGSLYQWAPDVATAQYVTNGSFATGTGWTLGTGWAYGVNQAVATAGVGSDLSQVETLTAGTTYRISFILNVTAGTITPKMATVAIGAAIAASGTYVRLFTAGAAGPYTLAFSKDATFAGNITAISITVEQASQIVTNAPTQITSMFVSKEGIIVACGANDQSSGTFNPMLVRWSDIQAATVWTAAITNLAGQYPLSRGGRIVAGIATKQENVIFTDTSIYSMRFTGNINTVFDFFLQGSGCGLYAPHAAAEDSGSVYFWSSRGQFMVYNGSVATEIPCGLLQDTMQNVNQTQADKIYCFTNSQWNEIWWLYPDIRDGTNEISRYVAYNKADGSWFNGYCEVGVLQRTTWIDQGVLPYPLSWDANGQMFFQEVGTNADGADLLSSLTSGFTDIDDGQDYTYIDRLIPDLTESDAQVEFSVATTDYPAAPVRTISGLVAGPTTRWITFRARGRQIQLAMQGIGYWRLGSTRVNASKDGRR